MTKKPGVDEGRRRPASRRCAPRPRRPRSGSERRRSEPRPARRPGSRAPGSRAGRPRSRRSAGCRRAAPVSRCDRREVELIRARRGDDEVGLELDDLVDPDPEVARDDLAAAEGGACLGPSPCSMPAGMPTRRSRAPRAMTSSAEPGSSATIRSGLPRGPWARSPAPCTVTGYGCSSSPSGSDRCAAAGRARQPRRPRQRSNEARSHVDWHYGEDAALHAGGGERRAPGGAAARRADGRGAPRARRARRGARDRAGAHRRKRRQPRPGPRRRAPGGGRARRRDPGGPRRRAPRGSACR